MQAFGWGVITQPPYNLNLLSSGYYLFPKRVFGKNAFWRRWREKETIQHFLIGMEGGVVMDTQKLLQYLQKFVDQNSNYLEK